MYVTGLTKKFVCTMSVQNDKIVNKCKMCETD